MIEEENLKKIFARIEAKTKWPMPLDLQNELLNKFEEHRVFLVSELNNNPQKDKQLRTMSLGMYFRQRTAIEYDSSERPTAYKFR